MLEESEQESSEGHIDGSEISAAGHSSQVFAEEFCGVFEKQIEVLADGVCLLPASEHGGIELGGGAGGVGVIGLEDQFRVVISFVNAFLIECASRQGVEHEDISFVQSRGSGEAEGLLDLLSGFSGEPDDEEGMDVDIVVAEVFNHALGFGQVQGLVDDVVQDFLAAGCMIFTFMRNPSKDCYENNLYRVNVYQGLKKTSL